MYCIEVFSGCGGLALGLHLAGFKSCGLYEIDAKACATIRGNVSKKTSPGIRKWLLNESDIREKRFKNFEGIDLLAGGPPCQPFSQAGKHEGQKDARDMIPQFSRILGEIRPKSFIMENVRGLTRRSFADYMEKIVDSLRYPCAKTRLKPPSSRSYEVKAFTVNSADYGIPQQRHRVFFIGFRKDLNLMPSFPPPKFSKARLLESLVNSNEYCSRHRIHASNLVIGRMRGSICHPSMSGMEKDKRAWVTIRDSISDLAGQKADVSHKTRIGAKMYSGHTGSYYDLPAKALKAGVHGVPGGENMVVLPCGRVRHFSVREAARLQSFPDSWVFHGSWSESMKQIGNAVPVLLSKTVGLHVKKQLTLDF